MADTPDVFVNCPFDADYEPLLHAVLFTVEDCGFRVRCALGGGRFRVGSNR